MVPLMVGLFSRKNFSISSQIHVDVPREALFHYVRYINNHKEFSNWLKEDPKIKIAQNGVDGKPGFVYSYISKNPTIGEGEIEITRIIENEILEMKLRSFNSIVSESSSYMETKELSDSTSRITWGLNGVVPYPLNFFLLFSSYEKDMKVRFDENLLRLKQNLEKETH